MMTILMLGGVGDVDDDLDDGRLLATGDLALLDGAKVRELKSKSVGQ